MDSDGSRQRMRSNDAQHPPERFRTSSDPITKVVSKVTKPGPSLDGEPGGFRPSGIERRRRQQSSTRPDLPAARKRVWSCLEYQPSKANDNSSLVWEPEPFAPLASIEPPPPAGASLAPSSRPAAPASRPSAAPRASAAAPSSAAPRASVSPPPPQVSAPRPALMPPASTSARPSSRPLLRSPFAKTDSARLAIHSAPTVGALPSVRPASASRPVRRVPAPPPLLDYGPGVSQVMLSEKGKLLNSTHGADDELLAETVGFTHRLATLTARALGFAGCHSMYLRSATAAIIVSEREPMLVAGVAGKLESLSEDLRQVGLE
jgi:hypothetical protein